MIAALLIVMVLVFTYLGVYFGFNVSTTADYIAIIPSFLFILAGLYIVVSVGGMYSFPALSLIGVGMALLLNVMYTNGYITVQMMSGLTIQQIMFWCVVIGGLAGGIVAAMTSRR
jgi:hypothetical protein